MAISNSLKTLGVAAFLVASSIVGAPVTLNNEGYSLVPYYDSVGVRTWCAGETEVGYKTKFDPKECDLMYNIRYGYYSYMTTRMYNDKASAVVTPEVHAAMVDMSYNVGLGTVEKSTMIKKLNEGKPKEACQAILLYKKAGGQDCSKPGNKTCPGIWDRRQRMTKLCMKGT